MFSFRLGSFILPVVTGLILFAGFREPASAQVVCKECYEFWVPGGDDDNPSSWRHTFGNQLTACWGLYPKLAVHDGLIGVAYCSRCGGSSQCHTGWDLTKPITKGRCHKICTEYDLAETDFDSTVNDILKGFETRDMALVATALLPERRGYSVEYNAAGGRIDFVLPCDPGAYRTIAVLPELRRELDAELAERHAAATVTD